MRIASWNVNSLKVRLPHVEDYLRDSDTDVLALQETKLQDPDFPTAALAELGYRAAFSGQKTYNGVAVLARSEPSDVVTDIPGLDDPQRRVLAATVDGVRVVNLYVPNGQSVGSEKYAYKLDWLAALREWLAVEIREHRDLVVLGDFNIAPDDRDVHDPEKWAGEVHVSEPERAALQELLALGLTDSFRRFEDAAGRFSWWDYRRAAFRRDAGLRIDLVLLSESLMARCSSAGIDVEPRTRERPSDHTPVWVEID